MSIFCSRFQSRNPHVFICCFSLNNIPWWCFPRLCLSNHWFIWWDLVSSFVECLLISFVWCLLMIRVRLWFGARIPQKWCSVLLSASFRGNTMPESRITWGVNLYHCIGCCLPYFSTVKWQFLLCCWSIPWEEPWSICKYSVFFFTTVAHWVQCLSMGPPHIN